MNVIITIGPDGNATCLWTEELTLNAIGALTIERASTIEFNNITGHWEVRLARNRQDLAKNACDLGRVMRLLEELPAIPNNDGLRSSLEKQRDALAAVVYHPPDYTHTSRAVCLAWEVQTLNARLANDEPLRQ